MFAPNCRRRSSPYCGEKYTACSFILSQVLKTTIDSKSFFWNVCYAYMYGVPQVLICKKLGSAGERLISSLQTLQILHESSLRANAKTSADKRK